MIRMRVTMGLKRRFLIVPALVLGGGLPFPADAQQSGYVVPAYRAQQYQPPTPGHAVQLYSRPESSSDESPSSSPSSASPYSSPPPLLPPKTLPQTHPYLNVAPAISPNAGNDVGPGESSPNGSVRIQNDRGVRYVSGGIGEEERDELDALSGEFNLRLLFAVQGSGDYLSDVHVTIRDARDGVVLSAPSRGPWFFARLQTGVSYTVEATALGQIQQQTTRIGVGQSRLYFYWR